MGNALMRGTGETIIPRIVYLWYNQNSIVCSQERRRRGEK